MAGQGGAGQGMAWQGKAWQGFISISLFSTEASET